MEDAFELAEDGAEFVITRYRDSNANLRTQLIRIIERAGLKRWPKLFQNLRATRETELAELFPMHVVCAWIGNSELVAAKHYLQITEDHFHRAIENPGQNPGQQAAELARNDSQPRAATHQKTPVLPVFAANCPKLQCTEVGVARLELATSRM